MTNTNTNRPMAQCSAPGPFLCPVAHPGLCAGFLYAGFGLVLACGFSYVGFSMLRLLTCVAHCLSSSGESWRTTIMSRKERRLKQREVERWHKAENKRLAKVYTRKGKAELLAWVREVNERNRRLGVQA